MQRQKRNITKALYVMLSTGIDFLFFGLYLTDNMKSLLHVMSGEASGIRSALPALLKSSAKKKENKDSWMKACGTNLPVTNSFTPVVCLCTAAHFLPFGPSLCPVLIFLVCSAERGWSKNQRRNVPLVSLSLMQQLCNQTQI